MILLDRTAVPSQLALTIFAATLPRICSFSHLCPDSSGGPISLGNTILFDTTVLADCFSLPVTGTDSVVALLD